MTQLFAGSPLLWIEARFLDADGNPNAGGKIYSYTAGTTSPQPTYTDVDLEVEHTNPIILDAEGRPPGGVIYMARAGYKFVVTDANDVELYPVDNVEDVGATFAGNIGLVLYSGGKDVTSGYTVLNTDRFVTVDSDGGANPCVINLLPASQATQPVTIKNLGAIALAVTPNGVDTIEGIAAAFTVPAASSPTFPSILLVPDGVSAWWMLASHGL